jgi:predicted nucleic acid-binding protein
MSDLVFDSSVVVKWILPEADSAKARRIRDEVAASGAELVALDLVLPEVTNAIWVRHHRRLMSAAEATSWFDVLRQTPFRIEPSSHVLASAFDIALRYDRAVYDACFVALVAKLDIGGVTADEPLYNAVRADFPGVRLLRHC